jgi:hypothetical protein
MGAVFASRARALSGQYGGPYHSAVVVDYGAPIYDGGGSLSAPRQRIARDCIAQVDAATQAMRSADGFADGDMRILVLADSLSGEITTDSRVEILAGPHIGNWLVASVARDPFGAYWELRGRRAI